MDQNDTSTSCRAEGEDLMTPRYLGWGFLALSIYLLGIYALSLAMLHAHAEAPEAFRVRLAFLDADFEVMHGVNG